MIPGIVVKKALQKALEGYKADVGETPTMGWLTSHAFDLPIPLEQTGPISKFDERLAASPTHAEELAQPFLFTDVDGFEHPSAFDRIYTPFNNDAVDYAHLVQQNIPYNERIGTGWGPKNYAAATRFENYQAMPTRQPFFDMLGDITQPSTEPNEMFYNLDRDVGGFWHGLKGQDWQGKGYDADPTRLHGFMHGPALYHSEDPINTASGYGTDNVYQTVLKSGTRMADFRGGMSLKDALDIARTVQTRSEVTQPVRDLLNETLWRQRPGETHNRGVEQLLQLNPEFLDDLGVQATRFYPGADGAAQMLLRDFSAGKAAGTGKTLGRKTTSRDFPNWRQRYEISVPTQEIVMPIPVGGKDIPSQIEISEHPAWRESEFVDLPTAAPDTNVRPLGALEDVLGMDLDTIRGWLETTARPITTSVFLPQSKRVVPITTEGHTMGAGRRPRVVDNIQDLPEVASSSAGPPKGFDVVMGNTPMLDIDSFKYNPDEPALNELLRIVRANLPTAAVSLSTQGAHVAAEDASELLKLATQLKSMGIDVDDRYIKMSQQMGLGYPMRVSGKTPGFMKEEGRVKHFSSPSLSREAKNLLFGNDDPGGVYAAIEEIRNRGGSPEQLLDELRPLVELEQQHYAQATNPDEPVPYELARKVYDLALVRGGDPLIKLMESPQYEGDESWNPYPAGTIKRLIEQGMYGEIQSGHNVPMQYQVSSIPVAAWREGKDVPYESFNPDIALKQKLVDAILGGSVYENTGAIKRIIELYDGNYSLIPDEIKRRFNLTPENFEALREDIWADHNRGNWDEDIF